MIQHIRITNNSRLSDRYLKVQSQISNDPQKASWGKLFVLIEIENPWINNAEIGQTIINSFNKTYFNHTSSDPVERLEEAARLTNKTLHKIDQMGANDWVGNLNAAIILIIQDEIHIIATGKIYGWLARRKDISLILEPMPANTTSKNIFQVIISGNIEPQDRLFFASSGILKVLQKKDLRETVLGEDDLEFAGAQLAQRLRSKQAMWVNGLIIEHTQDQSNEIADTFYIDSPPSINWRIAAQKGLKSTQANLQKFRSLLKKTHHAATKRLIPMTKQHWQKTSKWLHDNSQWIGTMLYPAVKKIALKLNNRQSAKEPTPNLQLNYKELSQGDLIGKSLFTINNYQDVKQSPSQNDVPERPQRTALNFNIKNYRTSTIDRIKGIKWSNMSMMLKQQLNRIIRSEGFVFRAVVVLLIVMLIININHIIASQKLAKANKALASTIDEMESMFEEAKIAETLGQKDKSLELLSQILQTANELQDTPLQDQIDAVARDAQIELDRLTNTIRLTQYTQIAQIPSEGLDIKLNENQLFILTKNNIVVLDEKQKQYPIDASADLTALTNFGTGKAVVLSSSPPQVLEFSNNQLRQISLNNGNWKNGIGIEHYFGNLYILAPQENQIWKYRSQGESFGPPEEYIIDGTKISQAVDLAIDGNIYVLESSGKILKFLRGRVEEFKIQNTPPTFNFQAPKQIFTTTNTDNIYILAGNTIIELNKSGSFIKQYIFELTQNITAFARADDSNAFYVVTENAVLKFDL